MVRKSNKKGASSAREEPVCNELTTDGKGSAPDSSDMVVELATAEQEYKGIPSATKKSTKTPTVNDMLVDPITQLASEHWASKAQVSCNSQMIKDIYSKQMVGGSSSRFQLLDVSGYLENYLWPSYKAGATFEHTISIVLMVNEKYKNGVAALDELSNDEHKCASLYEAVVDLYLQHNIASHEHLEQYLLFFINSFRSIENAKLRKAVLRYVSLPIWESLSKDRLTKELSENVQLAQHWKGFNAHKNDLQGTLAVPSSSASKQNTESASKSKSMSKRKRAEEETTTVAADAPSGEVAVELASLQRDTSWVPSMVNDFLSLLCTEPLAPLARATERYLERFAELLIDLLSQLPTRRFLKVLLEDMHFVIVCRRSPVLRDLKGNLLHKLLSMIDNYINFEVDDQSGQALTYQDMLERSNEKIHFLQQVAYSDFGEVLKDLVFCSVGELSKKEQLLRHLQLLDGPQLVQLGRKLGVITDLDLAISADSKNSRNLVLNLDDEQVLWELLTDFLVPRPRHIDELNMMPLYPNEKLLWDQNQLPVSEHNSGHDVLALPKLNLQFLSIHDYLLRNFTLFRLESAYEIRDDLSDAIKRMGPKAGMRGAVNFGGWARMALPIVSVSIDEVTKPRLGELVPRNVDCTVTVDISRFSGDMRAEWEGFREHDVVFLVGIQSPSPDAVAMLAEFESNKQRRRAEKSSSSESDEDWFDFAQIFGVKHVRGGELFELRDEANVVLNDPTRPDERKARVGNLRKLRLHLDPAQYYQDMRDGVDCYETLNLVVRRNAKENNFKAILQTIRELINTAAVGRAIPTWMHDVFLGYGNPKSANYRSLTAGGTESIDYGDTFIDAQHVMEAFPQCNVVFESGLTELPPPPYRITTTTGSCSSASEGAVVESATKKSRSKKASTATGACSSFAAGESNGKETLVVKAYRRPNQGPYPEDAAPTNTVRFTPTQIEAIRSGTNPGLTMVVGPPGTGKTDVAVQIIVNLYRNHPTQKILIVTHSNAALNDLFEKIMERDVAPRHLLRLGSGEMDLRETLASAGAGGGGKGQGEAFSKQGRVNWSLARRLQLLSQVQRLSASIGIPGDVGNSCETAEYFQLEHVQSRIEKFKIDVAAAQSKSTSSAALPALVQEIFPFNGYFSDVPALFRCDLEADLDAAQGCFVHIGKIFEELKDYRAFELLRSQSLRSDFLLTKQARIVAMTCTHAAMTRGRLVDLGFKYDSIVMEEAAQVLEVETLIPMLLQDTDPVDGCRLKRVVLIGDHHQLPPVVKHMAFQKFCRLDQSLFTRFIRLGVPAVQLDRQGRSRAEIAALYSWRYQTVACQLGNLDLVQQRPEFQCGNPGFLHTFQFIDVPQFQGKGELCPTPFFYQNLGEAEYVVATYQYMRLLGYPAEKISIITTYNGQKELIRDIISQRCKNPVFGFPAAISTVDKFQGQQNDYILLSMVRTEAVGHVRDIRRLVVALSRARLGLYVFGKQALFENCYELSAAFSLLLARPSKLQLVAGEAYPATARKAGAAVPSAGADTAAETQHTVEDVTAMGVLVYQMVQQAQGLQQRT